MNTILITGCSSGFGLETARTFLARGWRVVATMRRPRGDLLPPSDRLSLLPLDVTDRDSVARAAYGILAFAVLASFVGTMLGAISVPVLASGVTWAIGRVFVQHFAAGGTFLTFDPSKVREHFEAATASAPAV